MTAKVPFRGRFSLRDQIERAAVSVSNNIAEGFERGTTQELLTFLHIARGSAGEVRSMLCLLEGLPGFSDLESEISNLNSNSRDKNLLPLERCWGPGKSLRGSGSCTRPLWPSQVAPVSPHPDIQKNETRSIRNVTLLVVPRRVGKGARKSPGRA
jgi:four helix bundle protein